MRLLIFFSLFLLTTLAFSQYSISGYITDTDNEPLSFASIVLVKSSDTSIVSFGLSNERGKYLVEFEDSGKYLLQYSFIGHTTTYKKLETDWNLKEIPQETVKLSKADIELGEVSIEAERIPMKMKGDTIQYDAKAFKVAEGSDVEKLLEKMPGIEIDAEGNITAHGKKVEKILVDGKEFFGTDPKMATKNLEAKAIDKVEVLDKKSKTAEFTGVDDGEEQKTINLSLKEEFKKGSFGKLFVGAGTEETYKTKVNYNRFNKNTQMSVIGNANNINERSFSFSEYSDFTGSNYINSSALNGLGGSEGINNSLSAGINLNHEFSKKLNAQAYYYIQRNSNDLVKTVNSDNFSRQEVFSTDQAIDNENTKLNHSFNVKMEWKPDSMTEVDFSSNATLADENIDNFSTTLYTPSREATNFTESISESEIDQLSSSSSLEYKRKFKKDRRNFSVLADYYYSNQEDFVTIDNERFGEEINQIQTYDYSITRPKARVSYTEPLDSFWLVTLTYSYQREENKPKRDFFDIDSTGRVFNDSLSSNFERLTNENTGTVRFRRNKKKIHYSFGVSATDIVLETAGFSRDFQYLTPFATTRYRLKGSQSFRVNYYTRTRLPSLTQLVTIPDNQNPNRIYIGNPNLKPEYSQNISFNYFYFNPVNSSNLYTGITLNSTTRKIVNRTIVNPDFTTVITPQNTGFYQSINFYAGVNRPIKKLKVKYSISPSANFSRYDVFLNEDESEVAEANYSTNISFRRLKKEKWDLIIGGNISYNERDYESNPDFNQEFLNYSWYANAEYEIKSDLLFTAGYSYKRFNNVFFSEAREFHFVNASLRKSFKDDKWAVSLIANDILNQNEGVQRSGDINSLSETRFNSRAQYFMLGIERSLGKKVENPNRKKRRTIYIRN